jgi:hypothetical protein
MFMKNNKESKYGIYFTTLNAEVLNSFQKKEGFTFNYSTNRRHKMNLKNLFKLSTLMLVFLLVLSSFSYGQTTYYVDVVNGLDGYNGLSATVGGTGVGPKQTINNAIAAASAGDIIVVAYANGNLYNENVAITKKMYFRSTGGTPNVYSFTLNIAGVSPANNAIFDSGTFEFTTGLVLTQGKLVGGSNITVAGGVTRTAGTVDSQLNYDGVVNFLYDGGAAITSSYELPAATDAASFGNLTTTGAGTALTLNSDKTINGTINTAGTLNLGTHTITVAGSTTFANTVSNGTLAWVLGANETQTGAVALPNITVVDDGASAYTLTLAGTTAEDITTDGTADVTFTAATTVGNVLAKTDSKITLTAATTTGTVTNSSSVVLTLTAATATETLKNTADGGILLGPVAGLAVTGDVLQSGIGYIDLNASTAAVTVSGVVTNNPTLDCNVANLVAANKYGVIIFPNAPVTISGLVTNAPVFTGTASATRSHANIGEILFNQTLTSGTDLTLDGGVLVNATASSLVGVSGKTMTLTNCGDVKIIATTANVLIPGGITVTTSVTNSTYVTYAQVGSFLAIARTTGTFGSAGTPTGPISISSTGNFGLNGNIKTAIVGAALPGFWGTSISATGAAGGVITLANEDITLSGDITSNKTVTGDYIVFGTAATAGVDFQIGGNIDNEGKSNISIMSFNGAAGESFAVTGKLISNGTGSIVINPAAALTGAGTFSFGGIELNSGFVALEGAGNGIMDVIVNGNANFIGGTFNMATTVAPTSNLAAANVTVAAGDRVLQLGGLADKFSSVAGSTDFSLNGNVVLLIQPTAISAAQTVTCNATQTVWPGLLVVKNGTGLQPAVTFTGGNFRVLSGLGFGSSQVKIDGMTLFVGGQLAPNAGVGDFYNWPGYVTANNGFISMNGNAPANVGGTGTFENFEVDMAGGVTFAANATFTKTFNLTLGTVTGGAFVRFNNATTYPTIVRNAGTFAVAPTFVSMVNVYYIGGDKTTANELPTAAVNKLYDLTVATTNGAVAGKGTVAVAVVGGTIVNGTLTIYPNQALLLNGVDLTMKGASAVINGVLANVAAGDNFILAATAGTAVTGTGWIPDVLVAANSVGNTITGPKGVITTYLGGNNVWGTDDFNTAATQANGGITFANGTGALTVNFGAGSGATNAKTHFNTLTTANAGNTFTLAGNTIATGNMIHPKGVINVDTFTLTFLGTAHAMTEGATVIGTGTLNFTPSAGATLTTTATTAANGPALDVANLVVNVDNANLQLTSKDLYVNGNLYVTLPTSVAGSLDINSGSILYAQGQLVSLDAGSSIITTGGTGILYSNVTTGTQTLAADGAVTIDNLTVAKNLTLSLTGATPSMTITTAFQHDGGILDFSAYNLTVNGTFTRTAGTYAATTGYLIINNATVNQGATNFDIPNLQFGTADAAVSPTLLDAGVINVTKILAIDINPAADLVTITVSSAKKLTVADGATVEYYNGAFDVVPAYGATIDLSLVNAVANGAVNIDTTVWPATPTLVQNLLVSNSAAATLTVSNKVNKSIFYQGGTFNVATGKTLTVADNSTITVDAGVLTLTGTGAVSYGTGIIMKYVPSAAPYVSNGKEIPSTVKDLSFTRLSNTVNRLTTLAAKPITVTGTLTINNDLTTVALGPITLNGNLIIGKDAFAKATNPVTTFGDELVLSSDANTTITVPAGTTTLAALTISKTNSQNTVTLYGGNLSLVGGTITFVKGLLVTDGNSYVQIDQGLPGTVAQGFVRNVAVGDLSHVVGNVRKTLKAGIIETFGRNEFPVGSTLAYAPVAITTLNAGGNVTLGVNVTASYHAVSPTGFNGLPIVNGVAAGSDVARYAGLYWALKTDVSLGNTKFDLELTAPGFADYDDINNVRIIRRMGVITDLANSWTLQGSQYNNYVSDGIPSITNVQTAQGLSTAGAIFTYGMKTRLSATEFAAVTIGSIQSTGALWPVQVDLAGHFTGPTGTVLTYTASSSNTAIATVAVVDDKLTITGVTNGAVDVTVRATDQNNDFITKVIKVTVNSAVGNESTESALPTTYGMSQNYPNPFNPTTVIKYQLPKESMVTVKVINMIGQEVSTLVNEVKAAGYHTVNFNASGLASGRYIAVIKAGDFTKVIKMNLLK